MTKPIRCYATPADVECQFQDAKVIKCKEHSCFEPKGHVGVHLNLLGMRWTGWTDGP